MRTKLLAPFVSAASILAQTANIDAAETVKSPRHSDEITLQNFHEPELAAPPESEKRALDKGIVDGFMEILQKTYYKKSLEQEGTSLEEFAKKCLEELKYDFRESNGDSKNSEAKLYDQLLGFSLHKKNFSKLVSYLINERSRFNDLSYYKLIDENEIKEIKALPVSKRAEKIALIQKTKGKGAYYKHRNSPKFMLTALALVALLAKLKKLPATKRLEDSFAGIFERPVANTKSQLTKPT